MKNRLIIGAGNKLPLLQHFIQSDFPSGVTVIDPTGTLAEAVADSIPEQYETDVFYFDPSDTKNVASFNVFSAVPKPHHNKLVEDLFAFFDVVSSAGQDTLTRRNGNSVLKNVLTILLDNENVSFLSVLEFLSDKNFRNACLRKCDNPMALRNWQAIEEWDKTIRTSAYSYVDTLVGDMLLSSVMYRTLQRPPSTFSTTKTTILIANLSRQKIGDSTSKLLGTLLISRAKTPVYINDFGFFASDYLASLFSQGGYTVAIQFLSELPKTVEQTVLGFPEKYVYRTTLDDADKLKFGVGVSNPSILVDLSPEEFLPKVELDPPLASKRFKAVRKRSIACHTRPHTLAKTRKPQHRKKDW